MMKRIVGWLVLLPLSVLVVVFALANRAPVTIRFNPLSASDGLLPQFEVPLFVLIYAMLLVGIILGGVASWMTQGRNRRERRQFKRDNERLSRELDSARHDARSRAKGQALAPADDFLETE